MKKSTSAAAKGTKSKSSKRTKKSPEDALQRLQAEIKELRERIFELESFVGPDPGTFYEPEELQNKPLGHSERGTLVPNLEGHLVLLPYQPKPHQVLSANGKGVVAWRYLNLNLNLSLLQDYGYHIHSGTIGGEDSCWEKI